MPIPSLSACRNDIFETVRTRKNLLLLGALAALGCRQTVVSPPAVPENIKVPDGQSVLLKASGRGVQIYACLATPADPAKFAWTFQSPEAELRSDEGKTVGKHYAGPTWESIDGSKVIGAVEQQAGAPSTSAIPWLLLKARSNQGEGIFGKVSFIQRVRTHGGKAPAFGCDQGSLNTERRVPYSADYYFYVSAR